MTLSGAYGRDYKTAKAAIADFNANKDFVVRDMFSGGGSYVNKEQLTVGQSVVIRFCSDRKVTSVKVKA